MKPSEVPQTLKDRLAGQKIMIDAGRRELVEGKIVGRLLPFAQVVSLDGGFMAEFAWPSIATIFDSGRPLKVLS